jgi:hypothetical protein
MFESPVATLGFLVVCPPVTLRRTATPYRHQRFKRHVSLGSATHPLPPPREGEAPAEPKQPQPYPCDVEQTFTGSLPPRQDNTCWFSPMARHWMTLYVVSCVVRILLYTAHSGSCSQLMTDICQRSGECFPPADVFFRLHTPTASMPVNSGPSQHDTSPSKPCGIAHRCGWM